MFETLTGRLSRAVIAKTMKKVGTVGVKGLLGGGVAAPAGSAGADRDAESFRGPAARWQGIHFSCKNSRMRKQ